MARKYYPYSLDRQGREDRRGLLDAGREWGIDPTFIRIAWVAIPLLTPLDFTTAIIAYAIVGISSRSRRSAR